MMFGYNSYTIVGDDWIWIPFITNIFDVRKLFLAYLAANINKISNFADAGRLAEARSRAMREGRRT